MKSRFCRCWALVPIATTLLLCVSLAANSPQTLPPLATLGGPLTSAGIDAPATVDLGEMIVCSTSIAANGYAWETVPHRPMMYGDGHKSIAFAGGKKAGTVTVFLATNETPTAPPCLYQAIVNIGPTPGPTPAPKPAPSPAPTPTPTPAPTPSPPAPPPNPYQPAPTWRPSVQPVLSCRISRADSIPLAALYASLANDVTAGSVADNVHLRAALIDRGKPLGLTGKYPGLVPVIEKYLTDACGLQPAMLKPGPAADMLRTLAWSVWEIGTL